MSVSLFLASCEARQAHIKAVSNATREQARAIYEQAFSLAVEQPNYSVHDIQEIQLRIASEVRAGTIYAGRSRPKVPDRVVELTPQVFELLKAPGMFPWRACTMVLSMAS